MTYYNTCSECGSNLDPGEYCECREEKKAGRKQEDKQEEKQTA